jgi:hypothetical protein
MKVKDEIADFTKAHGWDIRIVIAYKRGSSMVQLYRPYRKPEARLQEI